MKQAMSRSILFVFLYPLAAAAFGLAIFTPLAAVLSVLFAFLLLKVQARVFRVLLTCLSLAAAVTTASLAAGALLTRPLDALAVGGSLTALSFLAGAGFALGFLKRRNFWLSVGLSAAGFAAGGILLLVILYFAGGQDIARTVTRIFTRRCHPALVTDMARIFVAADFASGTAATAQEVQGRLNQILAMAPAAVIRQFERLALPLVRNALAGLLLCASMLTGLLTAAGVALMTRLRGLNALNDSPLQGRPMRLALIPPYELMLPRRVAGCLVATFLCALLLSALGMPQAQVMLSTTSMVAVFVFSVMGLCLIDFGLKICRLHWVLRLIIMIVALIVCSGPMLLSFAGMLDSILGLRKRIIIIRKPR